MIMEDRQSQLISLGGEHEDQDRNLYEL